MTTALACLKFGHDVVVLEAAEAFREIGAGIQLPPNAMTVFQTLGLSDALRAVSFRPDAIETRLGISGKTIFRVPLKDTAGRPPYLHIHRADYISVLYNALKDQDRADIRFSSEVARYETRDEEVVVKLKTGEEISGDVLVGADGIHSTLRTQMFGTDPAQFTGHVAWRCVVPLSSLKTPPPPTACAWFGQGKHAVTYRIRKGELVNFVGVIEQDNWRDESWQSQGQSSELISDFSSWHPIIEDILKACGSEGLFKWALYDRPPLSTWSDGRAVLLGDAAHSMLPFMAQGAAMAVEDAWCLASLLSREDLSIQDIFHQYEALRLPRIIKVQKTSTHNGKIFHRKSRLAQFLTYGPMWIAGKLTPSLIRSRLNWLYSYDIVSEMKSKR